MATNVTAVEIRDAIITQLRAELVPSPVLTCEKYVGSEFTTAEGFKRGVAGRCPALRVRAVASRTLNTHLSRRVDRVESRFTVIAVTDNHRGKDDRDSLMAIVESIRRLVGARRFTLPMSPMRYLATDVIRDDEQALSYGIAFATRHRVDYTRDVQLDDLNAASGQVFDPETGKIEGEIDVFDLQEIP